LPLKQLDQRPFLVRDADAPIIVALQLGHFGHFLFQARLVPPGAIKGMPRSASFQAVSLPVYPLAP